jgi:hypothetical protein
MPVLYADPEVVQKMHAAYVETGSAAEVARRFNRNKSSVLHLLQRRGLAHPRKIAAVRIFNGVTYRKNKQGYWYSEGAHYPMLHRAVWAHHRGDIGREVIVRFKDENRDNCSIKNLKLARCGAHPKNTSLSLEPRNAGSRSFWSRMTPAEKEMFCLLRALQAWDRRRANRAAREHTAQFLQMGVVVGVLR